MLSFFAKADRPSGEVIAAAVEVQSNLEQKPTKATKTQSRAESGGETRQEIVRIVSTMYGGELPCSR